MTSRCPQSQPIKQKIKRKVKTNNKSFDDEWRLKRLKVTVTKKEHEDLEMFLKMLRTDRKLSLNHCFPRIGERNRASSCISVTSQF